MRWHWQRRRVKSIIADLGSLEGFFADVGRAKLGRRDELVTAGAKEWTVLKDANDDLLPLIAKSSLRE